MMQFKSLKQKFGARRGSAGTGTGRDDLLPVAPNSRTSSNPASVLERKPTGGAARNSLQGGSANSTAASREKPPLPDLSEESCQEAYAEPLPTFREVPASEKQQLFVRKLHLCSYTFNFADQGRNVREKEIKRQTLLELVDYVNTGSGKFTEGVAEDIVFMLSNNLFRGLPAVKAHDGDNLDPDEEEPAMEPAWPHLQVQRPPLMPTSHCMLHLALKPAAMTDKLLSWCLMHFHACVRPHVCTPCAGAQPGACVICALCCVHVKLKAAIQMGCLNYTQDLGTAPHAILGYLHF